MIPRKTVLGGVHEQPAHNAAQGILRQDVVADVIDGHGRTDCPERGAIRAVSTHGGLTAWILARACMRAPAFHSNSKIWRWRLLLPGASEPRLKLLRPQDFSSVFQTALRGLGNRSIVVVGNYECGPITVEPCRAKARPLRPRRSYFAPVSGTSNQRSSITDHCLFDGGGAGYCPRVR